MPLNMTPGGDAPIYSPQRDFAYLAPALFREVFCSFDAVNWSDSVKERFLQDAVTENEVAQACKSIVTAIDIYIMHDGVASFKDAWDESGLSAVRPVIKDALFARFGEAAIAGLFDCIRQVKNKGFTVPSSQAWTDMLAAGFTAVARLEGTNIQSYAIDERKSLEAKFDHLNRAHKQLLDMTYADQEKHLALDYYTAFIAAKENSFLQKVVFLWRTLKQLF